MIPLGCSLLERELPLLCKSTCMSRVKHSVSCFAINSYVASWKNDADCMTAPRPDAADAVAEIDAIRAARTLHGPVVNREITDGSESVVLPRSASKKRCELQWFWRFAQTYARTIALPGGAGGRSPRLPAILRNEVIHLLPRQQRPQPFISGRSALPKRTLEPPNLGNAMNSVRSFVAWGCTDMVAMTAVQTQLSSGDSR